MGYNHNGRIPMPEFERNLFDPRPILRVSQVVADIKTRLEKEFRHIRVLGEVSNLRIPASGHFYFTLKEEEAQLKAVCFRLQNRLLKFRLQDGMEVIARGSISVYPPRGDLQMVVESMEPVGAGALQMAFEQLKKRLLAEGLFQEERKQPLPLLPRTIGVITSPTGAAIRDILRVLKRRNDRVNVLIYPARVQGNEAAGEIASGLAYFNRVGQVDVIIVGRGGGSLEDLWAFNEEEVARAIAASRIPVISAVGHETDVTIADFVADLRAATPSAAAETVTAAREELERRVKDLGRRLRQAVRLELQSKRERLARLASSRAFVNAEGRLRFFLQRLDELHSRLERTLPALLLPLKERVSHLGSNLTVQTGFYLRTRRQRLEALANQLRAFSPQAVLERGYAIVLLQGQVVRDPARVGAGDRLDIRVARGHFHARKVDE